MNRYVAIFMAMLLFLWSALGYMIYVTTRNKPRAPDYMPRVEPERVEVLLFTAYY